MNTNTALKLNNEEKTTTTDSLKQFQSEIIEAVRSGAPLLGKTGVMTPYIKQALEAALEGEMDEHLESCKTQEIDNRRNGKLTKSMRSDMGSFELSVPRDREGDFNPQIVKKRQTILNESLDQRILSLFEGGMSYSDISHHLEDLYDFQVAPSMISKVTDRLLPVIQEWRSRPLASVYAIVFMDAIFFKSRVEGRVEQRCVYNLLGIDLQGRKEVLGFYTAETEGARFWSTVLADLKNRGVTDILIACVDGLKGFPQAIQVSFPQTEIQLCIVHQIRNSLKYIASKDQKEFLADLKEIYKASSKDLAEDNLLNLDEKWGKKYPLVIQSWQNNWEYLSAYFKYEEHVRRLIYTTNPIEGVHRQIRKYTKSKAAFTSENALFKVLFCAIKTIEKKWTMPIPHWGTTASQLYIHFGSRVKTGLAG